MMWWMMGVVSLMDVYCFDSCLVWVCGGMVDVKEGVVLFLEKWMAVYFDMVLGDLLYFLLWMDELEW